MKLILGIAFLWVTALCASGEVLHRTVLFDFRAMAENAPMRTEGAAVRELAGRLRINVAEPGDGAPSAFLLSPHGHWDLSKYRYLEFDIHNVGKLPANVSVFAVVPGGFGAASTFPLDETGRELVPIGAWRTLRIDLHQRFPDRTETINPRNITQLRIVLNNGTRGTMIDVLRIQASGEAPAERHDFPGRLIVPPVEEGLPAPGRRVYMSTPGSPVRYVLYLPTDWDPDRRFPIIAEYSGNIFFFKNTYSTGKADQGHIGYGMSKGTGAIWINLPFLSLGGTREQLNGFGDANATAEYARKVVREVIDKWSGDPGAVILTGFSRGGAACGFIGLRNREIADIWLGFHAVGGGDGAGWFGSDMRGALQRAVWIRGRSSFVTDGAPWQDVLARMRQPFVYRDSLIGAHVDTMFLDDRPSTLAARKWLADVLRERPGVHDISGTVWDREGNPVEGALVESGYTHIARTDCDGKYTIRSVIDGPRDVTVSVSGTQLLPRHLVMAGKSVGGVDFRVR